MKKIYLTMQLMLLFLASSIAQTNCVTTGITVPAADTYLNSTSTAIGIPSPVILLQGTTTINSNYTLNGVTIYMSAGARINIQSGSTFTLDNCTIKACDMALWDYIKIPDDGTHLVITGNSLIQDANTAIVSDGGGIYNLTNSTFFNNDVHIDVNQYTPSPSSPHLGEVTGCTFNSLNLLNGNQYSTACIDIFNVSHIRVGNPNNDPNTFKFARYGVKSNKANIDIRNNKFEGIRPISTTGWTTTGTAILVEGWPPSTYTAVIGSNISSSHSNEFFRCERAILGRRLQNLEINNNIFQSDVYEGIMTRKCDAINIENNSMNFYGVFGMNLAQLNNANVIIADNNLNTGKNGILVNHNTGTASNPTLNSPTLTIANNNGIVQSLVGIHVKNVDGPVITGNLVRFNNTMYNPGPPYSNAGQGIHIDNCINGTISQNTIFDDSPPSTPGNPPFSIGVWVEDGDNNVISENKIYLAKTGIKNENSTNSHYSKNLVEDSDKGFNISGDFSNIDLYCNTVRDCNTGFYFDGTSTNTPENIGVPGPFTSAVGSGNKWDNCTDDIVATATTTPIDWYYVNLGGVSDPDYNPTGVSLPVNPILAANMPSCMPAPRLADPNANNSIVSVYPNPANDFIKVQLQEDALLSIYDLTGRLVQQSALNEGENSVDVSQLNTGIYQSRITTVNSQILATEKIVISR